MSINATSAAKMREKASGIVRDMACRWFLMVRSFGTECATAAP
jgi:hypothetical protein